MALNTQTIITLVVIALVVGMMLLRNRAPRPLKLELMWVLPLIYVVLVAFGIWGIGHQPHEPFDTEAYAVMAGSLAVGAFLGWWRGKTITISRDPATNALMAQASPLGLVVIVAFVGVRFALRDYIEANREAWHLSIVTISDAFILFAAGLIVVSRLEMWVRARGIAHHDIPADPGPAAA